MSLVFNPPNPTQPTLSYSSVNTPENLEVWTKSGLNIYNTSLGNVSIGTTSVATYKLNVNGSLNFTTLYQSGTLIDFSNFATDSELTSGLATKQNIINSYVLTGGTNGSLGFSSGTLTLVLPSNYSTLSIASLTSGTSIIYKGTELSTTLNNYTPFTALLSSNFVNFPQLLSCNYANYTQLNNCNYITNSTTGLVNYPSYSAIGLSNFVNFPQLLSCNFVNFPQLGSSNYITNSTSSLNNYPSYSALASSNFVNFPQLLSSNYANYTQLNSCNYITNSTSGLVNYTRTGLDPAYLLKSGGIMSGQITGVSTLSATTGIFGQVATTNNTNTGAPTNGVYGGTGDKLILWAGAVGTTLPYSLGINTNELWYSVPTGATHKFYSGGGNPKMTILGNGNIGIGTDNPNYILHIRGANPTILRIETGNSAPNEVSGIEFGIPAFSSAGSAKITSTSIAGDIADLKFHTSAGLNQSSVKMTIRGDGNVGIGNANPSQILQVGNAGRLRISNGTTDYSLLGTIDTDTPATNTRIVVSGNTRGSGFAGNIDYVSTAGGSHIFYNSTTERMRILNNGNVGININNPRCHLEVAGIGCINNGSPYAVVANFMQSGSLTIGGINASYGGGVSQWTTNTAGLLLECSVNTEIAVHDANTRVASLMYYEGDANNRITIGRNMGWSAISSVVINGALSLKNSDWHKSFDNANRLYFANNGFTQYGNGGGVIGHDFINNTNSPILTLYNDTNVRCTNNLEVVNYLYSKSYICTAEDYSYVVNWNGTTNSGWFVGLNKYWYSGHTCLNVSITALNAGGTQRVCWFGRVYLSFATGANTGTPPANNGGVIQISTDYRNPASYSPTNYYIDVEERWDGAGNNALFIRVANAVYGGTLRIKIRG